MRGIKDLTLEELEEFVVQEGASKFHARQIFSWIYHKGARGFGAMSDLPRGLRVRLEREFVYAQGAVEKALVSRDGTGKLLVALGDGNLVESVLIPAAERVTGCVSTQAGCKFACAFCASGALGFQRNLSAGEILEEVLMLKNLAGARRLTHLVFMGTGEPFDNYDNLMRSIRIINAPYAFGIGARRITVSTCGHIPGIRRFAREGLQVELSVSLHAADEVTRSRLMPVNRKYSLRELIAACREYAGTTGRQVTFEYIMINGVNSDLQSADNLGKLMTGFDAKVNLIPCNPVARTGILPPGPAQVRIFKDSLRRRGIPVTVRLPRGEDIDAACGQLRLQAKKR